MKFKSLLDSLISKNLFIKSSKVKKSTYAVILHLNINNYMII